VSRLPPFGFLGARGPAGFRGAAELPFPQRLRGRPSESAIRRTPRPFFSRPPRLETVSLPVSQTSSTGLRDTFEAREVSPMRTVLEVQALKKRYRSSSGDVWHSRRRLVTVDIRVMKAPDLVFTSYAQR
jgi:hypothetical protein